MSCVVGGRPAEHAPKRAPTEGRGLQRFVRPARFLGSSFLVKFSTRNNNFYLYIFVHNCTPSDDEACAAATKLGSSALDHRFTASTLYPIAACFRRFVKSANVESRFVYSDTVFSLACPRDERGAAERSADGKAVPLAQWVTQNDRGLDRRTTIKYNNSLPSAQPHYAPYVKLVEDLLYVLCPALGTAADKQACIDTNVAFMAFDFVLCTEFAPDVEVPRANVHEFDKELNDRFENEIDDKIDADAALSIIQAHHNDLSNAGKGTRLLEADLAFAKLTSQRHQRLLDILQNAKKSVKERNVEYDSAIKGVDKSLGARERTFSVLYQIVHHAQLLAEALKAPEVQLPADLLARISTFAESCQSRQDAEAVRAGKKGVLPSIRSFIKEVQDLKFVRRGTARARRDVVEALEDIIYALKNK